VEQRDSDSRMPIRLLKMCHQLALIDDYEIQKDRVWIRQGMRRRSYDAREAEHMLDGMLDFAPTLKKLTADLERYHAGARPPKSD
jgi:hypothetical protein